CNDAERGGKGLGEERFQFRRAHAHDLVPLRGLPSCTSQKVTGNPQTSCTSEQASDSATSFAVAQVRIAARGLLLHASAQPLSDNLKWVLGPVPAPACPNTRTRAKAVPHVPGTKLLRSGAAPEQRSGICLLGPP